MSIKAVSGREVRLAASPKTIGDFKGAIDVGEVLRGRIVELFPENKALVFFKGFNLVAETVLPFKKGDIFYAQVKAKEPKIFVKILLPKERPHGFTDEDARETIRHLGHAPTPARIKIVKNLIRHNLAVTREMVEEIERHLPLLDGDSDENITSLIFMKSHGLKISPHNVELIKPHLFNRLNIGGALAQLQDALSGMHLEGKEKLLNIIEGMFIKLDEKGVDKQIKDFIKSIGIDYENKIANELDLSGEGREQRDLKDSLFKEKNLKLELLKLLNIIKRLGREGSSDPDKIKLQNIAHRVLKHILSSQLTSSQEGEDSYLYLQLPIYTDDGPPQFVELKVYYQDKKTKDQIDMDYLNLSLLLHTSKIGVVEMGVSLHQGTINIEFKLEDEYKKTFLTRQIPSLRQGLLGLGYRIGWLTSCLRQEDGFHLEKETDLENVGRIDFRV